MASVSHENVLLVSYSFTMFSLGIKPGHKPRYLGKDNFVLPKSSSPKCLPTKKSKTKKTKSKEQSETEERREMTNEEVDTKV